MVLTHQSRLPKELLQTGLRPILMNLADPKRLSIPGLEGLARLLELLTNYFKVEIGHKLLEDLFHGDIIDRLNGTIRVNEKLRGDQPSPSQTCTIADHTL